MAVPGSGTLEIKGLHNEKVNDNYNSTNTPSDNTMVNMFDLVNGGNTSGSIAVTIQGAGTATNYEVTNTNSTYHPDTSTPHAMNEWYNYDHDSAVFAPPSALTYTASSTTTITFGFTESPLSERVYVYFAGGALSGQIISPDGASYITVDGSGNSSWVAGDGNDNYSQGVISVTANTSLTIMYRSWRMVSGVGPVFSAYTSAFTGYTLPGTPTSLAASSITTGGMTISWSAPSGGATSYTYHFGTDSTVTNNSSASTTNTSVAISSLSPNVTYYFAVKAVGTGGDVGAITSTVNQTTQLGTPTNLHQDSNTTSQIVLDWDAPGGGATSYTVIFGPVNDIDDDDNDTFTGITNTTYTKTNLNANQTFYFFVKAVGTGTAPDSAFSSGQVVYTKPNNPTSLTTTNIGQTQMTIGWTAPTFGATSYTVYHGTHSSVVGGGNSSTGTSNTSITVTSLSANTRYYWGVIAVGPGGNSQLVTSDSYTLPNQITGLTASTVSLSPSEIDVSWTAPTNGASNYILKFVKSNPYGTMSTFSTQSSTSDTITGLDSNSIYYVGVISVGPSSLQSTIQATNGGSPVGAYTTPAAPTSLGFSNVTTSGLTFSWSAPSGTISGYTYYFILHSNISSLGGTATSHNSTSVNITGLASNSRYVAAAQASNTSGGGTGPISSTFDGYTQVAAPTSLGSGTIQENSIQFTWSDGTTGSGVVPSGYDVKVNIANNQGVSAVDVGTNTSYTKTGLNAGVGYYFFVQARGDGPVSGYVAGGQVFTLSAAPGGFSMGSITTTSITLSWNASTGATSYTYYFATSTSGLAGSAVTGHGSTSVTISGLQTNQRYYAAVAAVNPSGTGALTAVLNAYTKVGTPTSPTFTPNAGVPTSAPLSWTAPSNGNAPSSYYVRFGTYSSDPDHAANNSLSPNNVGNTTSHTITGLTAGNTYYFWVKAVGDGSDSDYTNRLTVLLIPGPPSNQAITPNSSTQVTLSWTGGNGASSYNYWFGTSATYTSNTKTNGETSTSVVKTGLSPNTRYYLRVESVNSTGTQISGTTVNAYTNVGGPVTNISAVGASGTSITVTFTEATGGGVVVLKYATSYNGTYVTGVNNGGSGGSLTQTGLNSNQQYFLLLVNTGFNGSTTSTSPGINATTFPGQPTNATITANSATSITVSWTAPASGVGTQGYKYHFGTNSTVANNTQYTTTSTSATHTVVGNTRYYFMVAGVNNGGTGTFTAPINVYTPPADIDNSTFSLAGTATDKISINFTEPAGGVASYTVKFAVTSPSNTLTTVSNSPTSTPFIVDIGSGIMQQAFFQIQPVGDTGLTGTNTMNVSGGGYIQRYALPAPPSGLSASSITHNSATLSWSAGYNSSGASYKVFVGTNSNQSNHDNEYSVSSGTLSLSVSGLSSNTLHYFWVQGVNPNGDVASSTLSSAATFTTAAQLIVSSTVHRISGTGRGMTFTVDNNGETISGPNQSAGSTANLESSAWRVTWSGADATTTSTITIPSGPSVKQASSASSIGGATYTTSPSALTMSNLKQHYWQLKETVTYMGGQSTVTRNVVVTNNTVSVTIPITWSYFGTFGAGSDRRLKTDVKKIGTSPSGIPIYEFRFKDDLDTLWEGTIAQDLLEMGMDDVVGTNEDGFYTVDYDKIDVDQIQVIEIDGK